MIKDRLENAKLYYECSKLLKMCFEWLQNHDLDKMEPKKYIIHDDKVYANLQEYETKENADYEAHRKYIDIQYMIKGCEKIGVCNKNNCETTIAYDSEKDVEFMKSNKKEEYLSLNRGEFIVLFPSDAHKPSITLDEKQKVKKVVVKVAID